MRRSARNLKPARLKRDSFKWMPVEAPVMPVNKAQSSARPSRLSVGPRSLTLRRSTESGAAETSCRNGGLPMRSMRALTAAAVAIATLVATPAAAYLPFMRTGNLVFLSGHIAKKDGKPWVGQLGLTTTTEEGKAAARAIAIDLMGTLQAACGGDLDRVVRIVKVMSLVNSTPTFTEQHLVTNGCSELLGEVFGPQVGAHARSAFGVAQIPLGACVEIELIAEIKS
eukprot:gene42326-56234_t